MAVDREATARRRRPLSDDELDRLRRRIRPDAAQVTAEPLVGGLDTATYRLRLQGRADEDFVVRIYREYPHDRVEAARREFAALTALSRANVLAPRPVLGDPAGDILGDPLIVMTFFHGAPRPPDADAGAWARQMADALADVHDTPLANLPPDFRRGESPQARVDRILAKPPERTEPLWDSVAAALPSVAAGLRANAPTLIHGDFWFGNTIWDEGRLTGIVDWDGVRIDDPALDVSIARNDIVLFSGSRTADIFLDRYRQRRGALAGLRFWDLVACLSPIKWLAHWVEGYQELGVALPLADARERLAIWVDALVREARAT
ncbi:MAG TPA: aminoglycoside phosphotransferase family protein [Candidatus Limnocylindria bacterium]|nr:aminoglycoside phosphotransferase family protein [Candidatus Limnocylindria bacterium]